MNQLKAQSLKSKAKYDLLSAFSFQLLTRKLEVFHG